MTEHVKKLRYNDTEMLVFYNDFFEKIRTVVVHDQPWFVGIDVASALGYKNPNRALTYIVDDEDMIKTSARKYEDGYQVLRPIPPKTKAKVDGVVQFPYVLDVIGRVQRPIWINEAGLNEMITQRSDNPHTPITDDPDGPTVKDIRDWIHGTVLPSVRRYSTYGVVDADDAVSRIETWVFKRSIDHDGFMHLIAIPGGPYEQFHDRMVLKRAMQRGSLPRS